MADGRTLQIFRDGRKHVATERVQLPVGAQANLYTLSRMAEIVREDSAMLDMRAWVRRDLAPGDTVQARVNAAFAYCRDKVRYLPEADDTETIADLWSCLNGLDENSPVGDCAIKSVALATCLGCLNLRPFFRALQQLPDADFYNHVFVGLYTDGKFVALDPTPPEFRPGDQLGSITHLDFQIWPVI
jgi:transglutaminase-like putative cysteine protease